MEVLAVKVCGKHKLQAHRICSSPDCLEQNDILVCSLCQPRHLAKGCEVLEVALLNESVHELMRRRLEFEGRYQVAVEDWLDELRKFKVFKEELMSCLNARQRQLNDLCRKIRRTIPYQKDHTLFKKALGNLYLSTRALSPNYDLYAKFGQCIEETLTDCQAALHRFRMARRQVPLLRQRDNQICVVLREVGDPNRPSVPPITYAEPTLTQFKRETVRYPKQAQAEQADSGLRRLGDSDFLAFNCRSQSLRLYNTRSLGLSRSLWVGAEVQNLEVLGRHLFLTDESSHIYVYDLLNQKVVKEFSSTNHRHARITALLSLDRRTVLNFIHEPNQVVALTLEEGTASLRLHKGQDTKHAVLAAALMQDQFAAACDDQRLRLFDSASFDRTADYELEAQARWVTTMDSNTVLVGGQSPLVNVVDRRAQGLVARLNMQRDCLGLSKIYPSGFIANLGTVLTFYELRMQKELHKMSSDSPVRHLEVLSSMSFVTSGRTLAYYEGLP